MGTPLGTVEANPLGLSLGFIEGMALVSLRDRAVADGLTIRALDLELLDVSFPLDLEGGAEEFQRRSTRLRTLVVDLEIAALASHLQTGLTRVQSPLRKLALRGENGTLALEGELVLQDRRARLAAQLVLTPNEPREVKLVLSDVLELGYFPLSALSLPDQFEAAVRELLEPFGDRAVESLRRAGAGSIALDAVGALLFALFPRSGWKVPQHEDLPIHRLELRDGVIRLEVGDLSSVSTSKEAPVRSDAAMRALAKDDAGGIAAGAEKLLESGDVAGAFAEMRARLDASGGPEVLVERLLSLGSSDPQLFVEAGDLANDQLRRRPDSIPALLAKARIATYEGKHAIAFQHFERAAKVLRETGRRRQAGFAFIAASRAAKRESPERARVLEDAIALLPDDVEALSGLVEELPSLGRASAALRAARRLASLSETADMRVRAHTIAGDLLRGPLADAVQAKREYEKALKASPEDPLALEGLARAVMDGGEPRRAATIFEKLIARAEAEGESERASRLSIVLGELWRPLDPEAAMVRFRRAHDLDRKNIAALAKLAEAAAGAGRPEAALDAVEQALPLVEGEDAPELLELRLRAGALLAKDRGRRAEAIAHFESALRIDPKNLEAYAALHRLYEETGGAAKLLSLLGRWAEVLVEKGDLDNAASRYRALAWMISRSSGDREALAAIHRAIGEALNKDRKSRAMLDAWVEVAEQAGHAPSIVEAIDRRLLLDDEPPIRAALLERFGVALEQAGRTPEAIRAYEEAIARHSSSSRAIDALVRIYRAREDHERLAAALERAAAVAFDSERAEFLGERAKLLAALGRDADAFEAVVSALEAAPRDHQFLPLATLIALRTQRFVEARMFAQRRLTAKDASAETKLAIHLELVRAAEGLGDRDALIAELQAALALAEANTDQARSIVARLTRELYLASRFEQLAALQRTLAAQEGTAVKEAVERWIEAGRLAARVGQKREAEADVRRALAVLEAAASPSARPPPELQRTALDLLEALVREHGNTRELAEVLGQRALAVDSVKERERLRLEQARVLEEGALDVLAVQALEAAADELPASIDIARALGEAAERAGQLSITASSYGRAAKLAAAAAREELAIELHGRAAEACAKLGDVAFAVSHDRALLSLCPPGSTSPWLGQAIDRLEKHAREEADQLLLVEVLSRRAATAAPSFGARLLLEKATIEAELLHSDKASLDSLRRARALAPEGSEAAEAIEDRLVHTLARLGQYADQAAVLVERAERAKSASRQAAFYYDAARVYASSLHDRSMALSRAQAAIRAFPNHENARELRLKLLREGGRKEALVDALEDEASMSADANEAARLWVEAAEILLPSAKLADEEAAQKPGRVDLERALDLVRRAATAAPKAAQPLRAASLYTRLLNKSDEEFVALEQLIERDIPDEERIAAYLRRVDLLRGPLEDMGAAQEELNVALALIDDLDPEAHARVLELLPSRTVLYFELLTRPLKAGVLRAGIELASDNSDWQTHVRLLLRLVDVSEDPKQRADLRTAAGEVLEWKLGDGAAAEREYRAALALDQNHQRASDALKNFYVGGDRFADLADSLGVEALRAVWRKMRDVEAPARVLAAGEALGAVLPEESEERAEVQLTVADLYITHKEDSAQAVHVLEQVIRDAPRAYQSRALERLSVLFLEQERYDLYVEVLRRQAERIDDDKSRARALAELGEALEWKLGDGAAAEIEYRAALAIDAECAEARDRLAVFLASQDRFEELGRELGSQVLAVELDRLVRGGAREQERAWKAALSLASLMPEDKRGTVWLRFAERARSTPNERPALERAATEGEPADQLKAFDRLMVLLEAQGDVRALANVLRQRVALEDQPAEQLLLHHRLGALLYEMVPEIEDAGREALISEAEAELRAALALDPEFSGPGPAEPAHPRRESITAHSGVRLLLESLYVSEGKLVEVGRVLGLETLRSVRTRAEEDGNAPLLERAIDALAELSTGEERAQHLVQLVELIADGRDPLGKWTPEILYRAALDAQPSNFPAREGLRALYESEGRYKDIALVLGPDALRETLDQLRRLDDQSALLPASLAFAHALESVPGAERERVELSLKIAELHFHDGDLEAGEHALWTAFRLAPDHPQARAELRGLMTRGGRLAELAEVDESLVTEVALAASTSGDVAVEIAALSVLAERKSGDERADTLVLIASLEARREDPAAAEAALLAALTASPGHALARKELEAMYWERGRHRELAETLGAEVLLARARAAAATDRAVAVRALEVLLATPVSTRDSGAPAYREITGHALLRPATSAEAFELSASLASSSDAERADLERAREIWDALEDVAGRERVRLAIAAVHRARRDHPALIDALAEALNFAQSAATRSALSVERATLLVRADRRDEAREIVQPLVEEVGAPIADRRAAARILVEELGEADLDLRARALELLTGDPQPQPNLDRWLLALASTREELGADGEALTVPLERALSVLRDPSEEAGIRTKLRELYEQAGDWRHAESHATVIAQNENAPSAWVSLSELREWLDDPAGAKTALERALAVDPAGEAANQALIRLAERQGDQRTVIERLSIWAKDDHAAPKKERAERLLRAARMAADGGDANAAAEHAERAFTLLDRDGDDVRALALEACAILEPLEKREAMASILGRAISLSSRSADLRIRLADLLISLDRDDEAATVIEQGIHRLTAEDDPLIERFLADTRTATDEAAARRLLALADRLGVGPAARRLRLEGAERAEKSGQSAIAVNAWSTIAAEVGGAESALARRSILRLARAGEDQATLISALIGAAEDEASPAERASLLGEAADRADRELQDADRAEGLLRRAIASDPANEWLRDRLLELFEERGRFAQLDDELNQRAETKTGAERAALFDKAAHNAAQRLRDHHRAALASARAYEAEPSAERAMSAARAQLAAGRPHEAAEWALRVEHERAGDHPRAVFEAKLLRAEALEMSGATDLAVEAMLEARHAQPSSELAEARLFELLARTKRWSDLAGVLDGFAERSDPAVGIRSRLAAAHLYLQELGDKAAALEVLSRALKLADRRLNDPEAAIPDPLARDPSAPLLELAAMAASQAAHPLRIDALRLRAQSLPVGPEQWRALFALATAEREAGDLDASQFTLRGVVDVVRKSDRSSPADRAEAELALGALLLDRKDAAGAAEALSRAVEILRSQDVEGAAQEIRALVQLAAAEKARGEHGRALTALLDAHALDSAAVAEVELEAAIEAAGPSKKLAELSERRAAHTEHPAVAARHERAAAQTYEQIGDRARALEPRLRAYRLDPTQRSEAIELAEQLYRAERWAELAQHQARRLEVEDLTDGERVALLLARAELLAQRLERASEALTLLYEARDLIPRNREVLFALADLAGKQGLDDVRADSLARLATVERSLARKQVLLAERAFLLERANDIAGAAQSLEEAVDVAFQRAKEAALSGEMLPIPRALVERLAALYTKRGHFASSARLWVRVAEAASGNEAAAALSRAGHIRLDALGDRRGAMAALEAAARQNPDDLGNRRALIDLAEALGDAHKARLHARAGIEAATRAGRVEAANAFLRDDERAAKSGASTSQNEVDEEYRAERSRLDRAGRFAELAALEERRASSLTDLAARSKALVEVARLYGEKGAEDLDRARDALVRAVRANADNVDALSRLAKLELEQGADDRAAPVFERLERLGGPPWPVPAFELLGARVARAVGQTGLEKVRLLQARARDPASIEALSRLAELSEGEGWLEAYEATIDPATHAAERAAVKEWHARWLEKSGRSSEALEAIAHALELDPQRETALALQRLMLEARPPSRALVDVLIADAAHKDRESALATLIYALGIAETNADVPRMLELAGRIEALAAPSDVVWPRIIKLIAEHGDGETLMRIADRLGGIAKLGPLSPEPKLRLARAALAQGRAFDTASLLVSFLPDRAKLAEAAARVLGEVDASNHTPSRVLRAPRALARLRSMLLQLGRDPAEARAGISLLEALYALLPVEKSIARRLARAYREQGEHLPRALAILRGLVEDDPLDPELVADLHDTAQALRDRASAAGPRAMLQLYAGESAKDASQPLSPMIARPAEHLLRDELRHPEVKSPLGELLRHTARAVAAALPVTERRERRRAADDPRLADLAEDVSSLFAIDFAITVDPDGGFRVSIEPGDPPSLVIGEALVDDATAPELRFHLARAAALLELGYAIVDRTAGADRRELIGLIVAACDPKVNVEDGTVELLRAKLGPAGLAVCESLAAAVKSEAPPIAAWMYGALATANRFALLAAGDLRASILALRRTDPRSYGERFDSREARLAALRRSSALIDLLRFAASAPFARLAAETDRVGAATTARFPL